MRKGLVLGMALATLVLVTTSIPAQAGLSLRFHVRGPGRHAPHTMVRPHVVVPPPIVIGPPGIYHTPRHYEPYYAPHSTYIPGRWHWNSWGWQWAPGFWIR
jgi:hypothetical protein